MTPYDSVNAALADLFGDDVQIKNTSAVSGGSINNAQKLALSNGETLFLKTHRHEDVKFFQAEADGVVAIAATGAIRTPDILAVGRNEADDTAFLLMRYIQSARPKADYAETLGHKIAAMHTADTTAFVNGGRFGFTANNYIGATPQINTPADSWVTFFRDRRLVPQFKRADHYFSAEDRERIIYLLDHLENYLIEPEQPSLLHGDLWNGNVMSDDAGEAMLIDPAVYVGDREADIAMTELFGGFSQAFYDAYNEASPLDPGYTDRRDLYNLYHLTNHLNLFGQMYYPAVTGILKMYSK